MQRILIVFPFSSRSRSTITDPVQTVEEASRRLEDESRRFVLSFSFANRANLFYFNISDHLVGTLNIRQVQLQHCLSQRLLSIHI